MNEVTQRVADARDLPAIHRLLQALDLPVDDLQVDHLADFVVFVDASGDVLGCGGVEVHGDVGLLRSVAVAQKSRCKGRGAALVDAVHAHARWRGLRELFLLTTTAAQYFLRHGYIEVGRDAAPPVIRSTHQFSVLCPASSTLMMRRI